MFRERRAGAVTEQERDGDARRVAERLRAGILDETLPSGQRLVERAIAEEFGVSRVPVRLALKMLAREGLVDHRPRGGSVVHTVTLAEFADLSELLPAFDALANSQAALRRTAADLPRVRAAADACVDAVRRGDREAVHEAGLGFRREVYRISGNAALQDVNRTLDGRIRRLILPIADAERSIALYEGICTAIEEGDPVEASAALERFLLAFRSSNRERMIDALGAGEVPDPVESVLPASSVPASAGAEPSRADAAFEPEAERVLSCLREQIVRGERAPGDALSERELSSTFAISRIPISEAIESLVADGLAWPGTARASARVRGISKDEADDLLLASAALNSAAVRLATQRATPAHIAALESLLRRQHGLASSGDSAAFIDSIFEFRDILHEASGNSLVPAIDAILDPRLRLLSSSLTIDDSALRVERVAIDALVMRDTVLADAVVRGFAAGSAARTLGARS